MTTITACIDEKDKDKFEGICNRVYLDIPHAIKLFVQATINDGHIPKGVTDGSDPFYGEDNVAYVNRGIQQVQDGRVARHDLIEV